MRANVQLSCPVLSTIIHPHGARRRRSHHAPNCVCGTHVTTQRNIQLYTTCTRGGNPACGCGQRQRGTQIRLAKSGIRGHIPPALCIGPHPHQEAFSVSWQSLARRLVPLLDLCTTSSHSSTRSAPLWTACSTMDIPTSGRTHSKRHSLWLLRALLDNAWPSAGRLSGPNQVSSLRFRLADALLASYQVQGTNWRA